ncbi:MAG: transposase, partial [Rickettsia endosymbiont of Bryobia graminum]|nr:transposase [Rickettsia endosymbiont of Bryobia graminum]
MRKGNIRYSSNRYHIVWITKYRYKVLTQVIKESIREIIAQVSEEMNIRI